MSKNSKKHAGIVSMMDRYNDQKYHAPEAKKYRHAFKLFSRWIQAEVAAGRCVTIQNVGVIYGTFRTARFCSGRYEPARYVLKFAPSKEMRKEMVRLANDPDMHFDIKAKTTSGKDPDKITGLTKQQREVIRRRQLADYAQKLVIAEAMEKARNSAQHTKSGDADEDSQIHGGAQDEGEA